MLPALIRTFSLSLILLAIFSFPPAIKAQANDLNPEEDVVACSEEEADSGNPQQCEFAGVKGTSYLRYLYTDENKQNFCQRTYCLDNNTLKPLSVTIRSQVGPPVPEGFQFDPSVVAKDQTAAGSSNPIPKKFENFGPPDLITLQFMNYIPKAGICGLAGRLYSGCTVEQVSPDGTSQLLSYTKIPGGGAIGAATQVMLAMYTNPPVSTPYYLAYLGENLGIIDTAYAQVPGSGESILHPILRLWQVVRNLAYLLFILVFITVGIMIMFRQRINPQTVVTVQNAIPGLVIGLILVTFSYFISALLVDIAFVGMQLVSEIFVQAQPNAFGNAAGIRELAQNSSVMDLFRVSAARGFNYEQLFDAIFRTQRADLGGVGVLTAIITGIIGALIGGLLGIVGAGVGAVVGAAAGPYIVALIVPFILLIALFVQFIRLLIALINAYITILISTVVSPLVILFSSLPGRGGALSFWWKTILANALIFPAVFLGFLFAGMILATPNESWRAVPPLFGGLATFLLKVVIAYGIVLGLPAVPGMVKNALGVKDIQGIPQEALRGAGGGIQAAAFVGQRGYQRFWRGRAEEGDAPEGPIPRFLERFGYVRRGT